MVQDTDDSIGPTSSVIVAASSKQLHSTSGATAHSPVSPATIVSFPVLMPTTSGISTRHSTEPLTARKQILKKRLSFLSSSKSQLMQKYRARVSELRSKMKTPKCLVNQALKRKQNQIDTKNKQIKELRNKQCGSSLAKELAETRFELMKVKNTHKKLLSFREDKKKTKTVSLSEFKRFQKKIKGLNEDVQHLENNNLILKEKVETLEADRTVKSKVDQKTFSSTTRMHVFDCIVNKTPTANIPTLHSQFYKRQGVSIESVPQRSAVEFMARELGTIAELQTAEMLIETNDVTLGFDATTQEEIHVNSIYFTTIRECLAAAVDELAGGTAEDYA